jgi:molybdenum storage protein
MLAPQDLRHHVESLLMRQSLLDKDVMARTETPVRRMLPDVHVVKIGGRSILDRGRDAVYPLVDALFEILTRERLIIATGGGVRARHVMSIALDLGLPTGVLAQLAEADALGNAHILGTLLAPAGVVAIPPAMFGHLVPLFIRSVPGVIQHGDPPYSLWEHPPALGRIPPHRSDTGAFLTAECFGAKSLVLVKDVDGVFDRDPKEHADAQRYDELTTSEIRAARAAGGSAGAPASGTAAGSPRSAAPIASTSPTASAGGISPASRFATLPFDPVLLDLLDRARLVTSFQVVNGLRPDALAAALRGERVGTVVRAG